MSSNLSSAGQSIAFGFLGQISSLVEIAIFAIIAIGAAFVSGEYPFAGIFLTALVIVGYGLVSIAKMISFIQVDAVDSFKTKTYRRTHQISILIRIISRHSIPFS